MARRASVTALCDRLNGFTQAVLPAGDKPTGTLRDQAVKILPMHSARGLQFRIVLLLWATASIAAYSMSPVQKIYCIAPTVCPCT